MCDGPFQFSCGMARSDHAALSSRALRLNTAVDMPQVGFGTYLLKKDAVSLPVEWAVGAGYQLIDTAWIYDNEKEIGEVLHRLGARCKTHPDSDPTPECHRGGAG